MSGNDVNLMTAQQSTAEPIRLAKRLAQSGLCSRKEASRLISAGQVTVNGQLASHIMTVSAEDHIEVAGKTLAAVKALAYWLYHKPVGIDCNNKPADPASIAQLLKQLPERVFAVGRLDKDSRGMLLLTNDGAFAQRLLHPSYAHQKRYRVTLDKPIPAEISQAFRAGIQWQVGPHHYQAKPCTAHRVGERELEITLTEGQHRQIRYMCRALGFQVLDLCRIAIGSVTLGELAAGDYRPLTTAELTQLFVLQAPEPTA
ncbi:pseudouridine synthase [Alishewanella sp. d11]|uniref:pseudouridine synthase n=1 Tax=Alishewanella sp. d11 TaxID=3414030 RepID=UPI003BF779F0